jgi:hypothetical protein
MSRRGTNDPLSRSIQYDLWSTPDTKQTAAVLMFPIFAVLTAAAAQFFISCALIVLLMVYTTPSHATASLTVRERCQSFFPSSVTGTRESVSRFCSHKDVDVNVCFLSIGLVLLGASITLVLPYLARQLHITISPMMGACLLLTAIGNGLVALSMVIPSAYCMLWGLHGPLFTDSDTVYFGQSVPGTRTAELYGDLSAGDVLNVGNFLVFVCAVVSFLCLSWGVCCCGFCIWKR